MTDQSDWAGMAVAAEECAAFCTNHPDQETALRCNRCEKPICTQCVVRTPVGYRCGQCVRGQQAVFDTALWRDYLVAAGIAFVLSGVAGALLVRLSWFVIFLAPPAGAIIAEAVRRAIHRRRGRYLSYAAIGAMVLAALPSLLVFNFWSLIYLVLAASTVYARLQVISI